MPFDLSTAKPVEGPQPVQGFDISTAKTDKQSKSAKRQEFMDSERKRLNKLAAEELNPFEAAAVGAGRGMMQLGRLVGLADDEGPEVTQAYKALEKESPIATTVGEVVGESAPFMIPGLGQAGLAAKLGGGAIARGATAAGLGALEGGMVSAANQKDATTGALVGGGVAAGAEFLFPKIGKAFRKMRGTSASTSLVDPTTGAVSPMFEKALFDEGLTVDNLVEASIKDLPRIAQDASSTAGRMGEKHAAKKAAQEVVKKQLQSGARDDSLAKVMLTGGQYGRVVPDDLASEVIKQGYQEGTVNLAKTANLHTRKEMEKALRLAVDIKKQSRVAQDARPSDFAGNALLDRVKYIRNTANTARVDLDKVAREQLKGQFFDVAPIRQNINKTLEGLRIVDLNPDGVPQLDFVGSMISGDPSSQKAISKMVEMLHTSTLNDAMGAHLMKRQLDTLINYSKKPNVGLGVDGENAIKGVRRTINETLRQFSDDYAATNDVLSMSLTAMDDLQTAIGKRINLSADRADSALGTAIRPLFGNRQKRIELEDSFSQIDNVASELGGNFQTNYKDIFQFTNEIEDVFGKTAKTSFGGEIEASIKSAKFGAANAFIDRTVSKAAEKAEKLRGINDFNAFTKMRKLLRRGSK